MSAARLDGSALAAEIRTQIARRVAALRDRGRQPRVAIVMATDDDSAAWYAQSIQKACRKVNIAGDVTALGPGSPAAVIGRTLRELSADANVSGIILQTPLPAGVGLAEVASEIDALKDIDGANPLSIGRLVAGVEAFTPATAEAVMRLIEHHRIGLSGREVVVVGRSPVVGKPLAHLLLRRDATVTIAHSRTRDLAAVTSRADVLVAAAGRPHLIGAAHIRRGASVIDVGTNVTEAGALVGDVAPEVEQIAGSLSPVPGGVGPVTTAVLLSHAVEAAERMVSSRRCLVKQRQSGHGPGADD